MLHWIFFTVAGVYLVGSFLRRQAGGKKADTAGNEGEAPGERE
ncbi:hypothetical protein C8J30_101139 [Rhodobacter viridis]|uniref:Uncharacterized protein n=1 Tax=Rhodobacter viridis TaxID=1054202 RepID=A0A318U2Q0_9RHOB|nr:hypothetical protein [Rhodobacter viridis]PYF12758.1 hypothetical protein C8J30_101139 [Rhodobacter viridis]